jgi:two-component system NtrC family sensor kinase
VSAESSGRRPLRNRLAFRLVFALSLGAAVIGLVSAYLNISLQREHMEGLVSESGERLVETIRRSTRDAMMRYSPEDVNGVLQGIASQPGIRRLRFLDKEGRILTSTHQAEVGSMIDMQAEQCVVCHTGGPDPQNLETDQRTRFFEDDTTGRRTLGIIAPIRNEPSCSTAPCHAHTPEQTVLGVLDVQLSLDSVDQQLAASETQLGFALLATVVAIILVTGVLSWRMVLKPVRSFTRASERVAEGDLTIRVPVSSRDEVGDMARSWNIMVEQLGRARGELEEWSHTLEERVGEKTQELETAHRRMLLVEKMASLGKLAAVVAHEINNPLAGIGTYARLLRRRLAKNSNQPPVEGVETAKILELVESEANRCGDIVRNLLLFSRTPGARFTNEQLEPMLERCIMLIKHQADLQEVRIELQVPPDMPKLSCDVSQIQQVVLSLCLNAIEAMPIGGVLRISAKRVWDDLVIVVEDSGCGIPAEQLGHIFEPFYTTKEQGRGLGLGLAVVYGIVGRHRGRVEVESEPGQGTTFTIHLPLKQPAEPAKEPDTLVEEQEEKP